MRLQTLAGRAAACVAGLALFAAGTWGALWVLLLGAIAAQSPDPDIVDGDPCCPRPDTWADVAAGFAGTLMAMALVSTLFALALALIVRGTSGRWLPPRRLATVPAGGVVGAALAMALALIIAA